MINMKNKNNRNSNATSSCNMKPEILTNINILCHDNFNSCLSVDSNAGLSDTYFSNE